MSVILTLRSWAGVWIVLITTLYKFLSSYQIPTKCIRIRSNNLICLLEEYLIKCIPVSCLWIKENIVTMNLWCSFTLSHICKMTNMLLKPLNHFDIKILIFVQCRTSFCQNKEKDVAKSYQQYTVKSGNTAWPFMLRTLNSEPVWLYLWTSVSIFATSGDSVLLSIENVNLQLPSLQLGGNFWF